MSHCYFAGAAFSFALALPFQCIAQDAEPFSQSVEQFATPANCSWATGNQDQADSMPPGYSAEIVRLMNLGNAVGVADADVIFAAEQACAMQPTTQTQPAEPACDKMKH